MAPAALAGLLLLALLGYGYLESRWVLVRKLRLSEQSRLRIAHLSDLHHRGGKAFLQKALERTAAEHPDLLCITGDLVEHQRHVDGVLAAISGFPTPVLVVPGNWDNWAGVDYGAVDQACRKTGGALLLNRSWSLDERLAVVGIDESILGSPDLEAAFRDVNKGQTLFLCHCPLDVELLGKRKVALALAGHSHGGQLRLPVLGAVVHRRGMGPYARGLYRTANGPLHVSSGLGTWRLPLRFLCRPEITLIDI